MPYFYLKSTLQIKSARAERRNPARNLIFRREHDFSDSFAKKKFEDHRIIIIGLTLPLSLLIRKFQCPWAVFLFTAKCDR